MKPVRVALVQNAPVIFDLQASLNKLGKLIREAAVESPNLILFPEAFISAYPRGLGFGTVVGSRSEAGRKMWLEYWKSSIEVPGPETEIIGKMAQEANCFLALGVTEKDMVSKSLYCSLLYFSPKGQLIGKHRKLKPTAAERIIWAEGDGTGLCSFDTPIGKISGLICWENYMPLARHALFQKGIEIYLAPTADSRDSWQASMRHIALEGRCFVLGCNQYVRKSDYPSRLQSQLQSSGEVLCRGGSVIYSPLGKKLAGPLYDQAGILYTDLDFEEIIKSKLDFDAVGHYARPDIFELHVKDIPQIKKIGE